MWLSIAKDTASGTREYFSITLSSAILDLSIESGSRYEQKTKNQKQNQKQNQNKEKSTHKKEIKRRKKEEEICLL